MTAVLNLINSRLPIIKNCIWNKTVLTGYPQECLKISNLVRYTSFFNKLPAEELWKGVTSVSNAGKKRGRGKGSGKKVAKDLNRGQIIGIGQKSYLWPGLNAPIIRGKEILQLQKLPENPNREENILKLRDSMGTFRLTKLSPIERGWSGAKMPGRSIGPPDAVGEDTFENFDTRVLENKIVFIMKGNMGRKRRYSVLTVTGNQNGLAGFAIAKAPDVRTALRKSKNRAGQKLININLSDNNSIYHDFTCSFGKTNIFVSKKPEGYGLVCHRAIQTICQVIGIKDLYAKIEGSKNLQHIVKAFFIGLLKQQSYSNLSEQKKLHVVEYSKEQEHLPIIKASPQTCRTAKEIASNEVLDFKQYVLNSKIVLKKNNTQLYDKNLEISLKKAEKRRTYKKIFIDKLVNQSI